MNITRDKVFDQCPLQEVFEHSPSSLKLTLGEQGVKDVRGCPSRPWDRSRSMQGLREKVTLQPGVINKTRSQASPPLSIP